jgi:hypothetical protein
MTRLIAIVVFVFAAAALCGFVPAGKCLADDKEAAAVLDKAIQALGGEEKLGQAKGVTWKAKGKINFGDADHDFSIETTMQGIDHTRQAFETEVNGNPVSGATVVAGDKGWRKFGDMTTELDADALANAKRSLYLQAAVVTLLPLKEKAFKVESAGEEQIDGKPAAALKITGPDGKDFTLYFDKESGLPVRQVGKVIGLGGEEYVQETTYGDYKDFGGIKKATKLLGKRDGEKFLEYELTEFKALDKVDAKTFAEPE